MSNCIKFCFWTPCGTPSGTYGLLPPSLPKSKIKTFYCHCTCMFQRINAALFGQKNIHEKQSHVLLSFLCLHSFWKHYLPTGRYYSCQVFSLVDILVMLIATNAFISTFVMELGIHWMQSLYAILSTTEITSAMVQNTIQNQRLWHNSKLTSRFHLIIMFYDVHLFI